MLEFVYGDLLHFNQADYIAQQVNCQGVMGAGLAKQIREQRPAVFEYYKRYCRENTPTDLLGDYFIVNNVISVFGQLTYGYDRSKTYTEYTALDKAFTKINTLLPPSKSIAFPYKFGCGLANGDWKTVMNIIRRCFATRKIYIIIKEN